MTDRRRSRPRARSRDPCIPGLVRQAFVKGSVHTAPCPALKASEIGVDGHCSFQWEAKGSSTYQVEAVGKLEVSLDNQGSPQGTGLKVTCSCPDGQRQAARALSENKIVVCKHAAAALESVLDEEAEARQAREVARLRQQRVEAAARQKEQEERAKQMQERDMPGERARMEYGLKALSDAELKKHLQDSCKTVEGLRAMAVVFPESIMPAPQTKYCVRCKKNYDDRYQEQKVCRMQHPYGKCRTEWDGSKISWEHCSRCDGDFGVPDYYRRRRGAPYDAGEWCFQGEHTQDEDLVKEENWEGEGDY